MHQQQKESLEADIPSSIVIGPFWINCDTVRNFLVKKRRELAKAVLELLAKKLRTQTEEVLSNHVTYYHVTSNTYIPLRSVMSLRLYLVSCLIGPMPSKTLPR